MFRGCCFSLSLLSSVVALGGCGGGDEEWTADRPKPVPAGGTVLYNQQPVEGATVVFIPQGHKHAATAQTDASGAFQLQTYGSVSGAVPGEFKVTVRKVEVSSQTSEESNVNDSTAPMEKWLIPERYGSVESSDLTASVTEGGENDFKLELHD